MRYIEHWDMSAYIDRGNHPILLLEQAAGPVAVDALLTRVFSLAMHPDKNRRLGGLMAFNQLCRPLREETALLDRYGGICMNQLLRKISLRRMYYLR